jgi:nucleoside-diphosphate-sugar epimerase
MRIGVFGASCEIGMAIVDRLSIEGHQVVTLGRDSSASNSDYIFFDLQNPQQLEQVELDSIVLLAWIGHPRSKESMELNLRGYQILAGHLREYGVFPIFISTITANCKSRSFHSRTKFEVEELFSSWGAVLRPGQVIEANGKVLGKTARDSDYLLRIGNSFRSNLAVPVVEISVLVDSIVHLAQVQLACRMDLFQNNIRKTKESRLRPLLTYWVLHVAVNCFAVIMRKQRQEILDRWYALIDT